VILTDPGLLAVLSHLGVATDALLGYGGEACVYALGTDRVVRVLHAGGRAEHVLRRQALVDELARAAPPFALPEVVEVGELEGRVFAVERRLPGRPVLDELETCEGNARTRLIEAHLDAAAALGNLNLEPRAGFGDLVIDDAITASTWRAYLEQKAAANLAGSSDEFRSIDPVALAAALPDTDHAAFVHLDAFAGNMLTNGTRITAVLDIGATSVAGDRRLDPLASAVYLTAPSITPMATTADATVVQGWLRNGGLEDWFEPARRWLAGYWSFAIDDAVILDFCRTVLLDAT
jgi:aminoglycoside phosphotransferase (APT) family kinase protein